MDITVTTNSQYSVVSIYEGDEEVSSGWLDDIEALDTAAVFLSAAWDLVRNQFSSSEEYFQWVQDNT